MLRACAIIITKSILWLTLGLMLILLSAPWWLPEVLPRWLNAQNIELNAYKKLNFRRFALEGLSWKNDQGHKASMEYLEAPTPLFALFQILGITQKDTLLIDTWAYTLTTETTSSPKGASSTDEATPFELAQATHKTLAWASPLFIGLEANEGLFTFNQHTFNLIEVTWKKRDFTIHGGWVDHGQPFILQCKGLGSRDVDTTVSLPRKDLAIHGKLKLSEEALEIGGTLQLAENPASFEIIFKPKDTLPSTARFETKHFVLSDEIITFDGYQPWIIDASALWENEAYKIRLKGNAQSKKTNDPPLIALIELHGDTKHIYIDTFKIGASDIDTALSRPDKDHTTVHIAIYFDKAELLPITGTIKASLTLDNTLSDAEPEISTQLIGEKMTFLDLSVDTLTLDGMLRGSQLIVKNTSFKLKEGSSFEGQGIIDFGEKAFQECSIKTHLDNALLARLLEGYELKLNSGNFTAKINGPWEDLNYSGQGSIDTLKVPHLYPLSGSITFEGHKHTIEPVKVEVNSDQGGTLSLESNVLWSNTACEIDILAMSFSAKDRHTITLDAPSKLFVDWNIEPQDTSELAGNAIQLEALKLSAQEGTHIEGSVSLYQMERGELELHVSEWDKTALPRVVIMPSWANETEIESIDLNAQWDDSPLIFNFKALGSYKHEEDVPIKLNIEINNTDKNIDIKTLSFTRDKEVILQGSGALPITILPANTEKQLHIVSNKPMAFNFSSQPAPIFWTEIAKLTGVYLTQPKVNIQLAGTPQKPTGTCSVQAESLSIEDPGKSKLPKAENLNIALKLSPNALSIEEGTLTVDGNPATIEGKLPWDAKAKQAFTPDWSRAVLDFKMTQTPIALFQPWLPDFVKDDGQASLDLQIRPDHAILGTIEVSDAATYPIEPFGPIREIQANIQFDKNTVSIKTLEGELSDQRLTIQGTIGIENLKDPKMDITIRGNNVPIVRAPGLILRGNLDLSLETDTVTTLTGKIDLEDSILFMSIGKLLAEMRSARTGGSTSFSVKQDPFSDWHLDIDIKGHDFMRVRTPVFQTRLSADLSMSGTFESPIPEGAITLHSGYVKFPFANLGVDRGTISLSRADPFTANLNILASGRAYGYDVKLKIQGTSDEPELVFSSSPSLESGEIVLLVTTGRLPSEDSSSGKQLGALGVFLGSNLLTELGMDDSKIQERLSVKVGEDVTESGKETVEVEYKLDDRWSVIGQYDRFDEFDVDLKWKIYSK